MDIMKKRISLILSVILLALVIVPVVCVNATSTNCQVSVETKMDGKVLQNNSRYTVSGGEKVVVRSSSTKAGIEFITHYFVTKNATTGEVTRTERYKDRNLTKVGNNNQGYGIYESTIEIPKNPAGTLVNLMVEPVASNDDGSKNTITKTGWQKYTLEYASTTPSVTEKKLNVKYGSKTLSVNSTTSVKAGDTIVITATPSDKVSKIWYNWNNEGKKSVTADTLNFKLPTTLKAGTYKLLVNAIYTDGLYVDGKNENSTNSKVYTFVIKDSSKPSNNRELDIEPWMEENDSTEELCVSLRNDSEEENKANKNIYALGEVVTYYIDYKNGGKKIDNASIKLELPLDFKAVDLDGGKVGKDNIIEWVFENGLDEDEAGTIIAKIKYTDLKRSRDDANTIYPTAEIYKGSKVKDVSTVINFIIREYDEEIDIEHEPYMYGDADSDTFRPDYIITRAEGALVLARIFGLDYTTIRERDITTKYTDINNTYFEAQQAITAASKAGLINGYLEADGTYTYRPNNKMTKAEFMKILACMIQENAKADRIDGLEIKDMESLVKVYDDATRYYIVDGKRVYTHWALEEITLLARLNMLPLTEKEPDFELDEKITRAEVAQLINFYLLRAPAEVTNRTKTGFSDVTRRHDLVGDIIEATRATHTFSITEEATEVEE